MRWRPSSTMLRLCKKSFQTYHAFPEHNDFDEQPNRYPLIVYIYICLNRNVGNMEIPPRQRQSRFYEVVNSPVRTTNRDRTNTRINTSYECAHLPGRLTKKPPPLLSFGLTIYDPKTEAGHQGRHSLDGNRSSDSSSGYAITVTTLRCLLHQRPTPKSDIGTVGRTTPCRKLRHRFPDPSECLLSG